MAASDKRLLATRLLKEAVALEQQAALEEREERAAKASRDG